MKCLSPCLMMCLLPTHPDFEMFHKVLVTIFNDLFIASDAEIKIR